MADTKISALPAVVAPAVGDEFACNQAGVTKKETKAQITAATDANLTAHIAVTAAGVHGSSVLTANDTLVHRSAAGLAHAVAFRADAGAVGAPGYTFTADPNTGHYNYAADELGVATGGAHRAHWNTTGAVILNDAAASSKMTGPGVTIQQGAYDDEAVAVKSTDVAHGITDFADTDTYFALQKDEPDSGGARFTGLKDADGTAAGALRLRGILGENVDTTKTTAGRAIVEVEGYIKSGTGIGNTNADGNVFAVLTKRGGATVTLLLVDEDGDLWLDGTLTANEIANRTRYHWIPATDFWDPANWNNTGDVVFAPVFEFPDVANTDAIVTWLVPADWDSGNVTVTLLWKSAGTGNVRWRLMARGTACTEDPNGAADVSPLLTLGIVANTLNCDVLTAALPVAAGDMVSIALVRFGSDGADTLAATALMYGIKVSYTADS